MALIGNGAQSEFQALAFTTCWASAHCACSTPTRAPASSWNATWRAWRCQA
jgi:ornithine cyclodeaminase/alanine dehydrogenase-like protein (mu-crystallin family)